MIAQIFLLCFISLAASRPYDAPSYPGHAYEPVYEARPEPYSFGFDTQDEYGRVLRRQEQGDELGNKRGSYGYVDPSGIYRQVEYVADENGFRAVIKTNEPGTDNQNPANTEILSEAAPVTHDAAPAYGRAPVNSRPAPVVAPSYARPAVAVAAPPARVPVPVSPAVPFAPVHASSAAGVYAQAPAYAPAPEVYAPAPAPYAPAPAAYGPVSAAYGPVPAAYGPVSADYAPSRVHEPLSPQSYAGPSYEQLSERASQPTESRSSSE